MRTKIVYVLVSQETDYYYEMLLLSLYSLRLHHPKGDAEVEVVMDEDTHRRLVSNQAGMLGDVTPVVVHIPEEYTVMQRSRYLKTQLRQLVKGDFLFLDTDTLVCEKLDDIDRISDEIAMVSDGNRSIIFIDPDNLQKCQSVGFSNLEGQPYFNSGVIFAKDTDEVKKLFFEWHRLWCQSIKKGISHDQPALCQANFNSGCLLRELSAEWNDQILCPEGKSKIEEAKILHYYGSGNNRSLILGWLKNTGRVDESIANIAKQPRKVAYTLFTMNEKRLVQYLSSDLLYVYDTVPFLFRLLVSLSRILTPPIQIFSKFKQKFSKW